MSPAPTAASASGGAPDGYTLVIGYWGTHVANGAIYALNNFRPYEPRLLLTTKRKQTATLLLKTRRPLNVIQAASQSSTERGAIPALVTALVTSEVTSRRSPAR
jgi:hypothetical protein